MDVWMCAIVTISTYLAYNVSKWLKTIVSFLRQTFNSAKALKQFPAEPYHWFFGHIRVHPGPTTEGLQVTREWVKKNPRYYVAHVGPLRSALILNHPETVKQILKTSEPKAVIGGGGYTFLMPWIGDGLLLSSGKKWHRNRKLLTPGFHFDVLKPYIGVYNGCVDTLLDTFERTSAKTNSSIDVYGPVSLCTLDIILRCAFSTTRNIQVSGKQDPYVTTVTNLGKELVIRALNPILYIDFIYYLLSAGKRFRDLCNFSHEVADKIIVQREKELREKDKERCEERKYIDFLDILLLARDEQGKGLTAQEIRDEVETFMFEGHDTTASGISWILYNLAKHPEIQAKAQVEVDQLFSGRSSDSIMWEDMGKLPYLTMCIKESLRLFPPVHFVLRQTTKPTLIDDKMIPAGSILNINIYNVHHNPVVWEDPMKYDPDRFLSENIITMDPHAFIPFSAGPRNCIGQTFAMHEMKTTVAKVLRKFHLKPGFEEEVRLFTGLILRPETTIPIKFELRKH